MEEQKTKEEIRHVEIKQQYGRSKPDIISNYIKHKMD